MLSDRDIINAIQTGEFEITPVPTNDCWQPCSIDMTLSNRFMVMNVSRFIERQQDATTGEITCILQTLDPSSIPSDLYQEVIVGPSSTFVIHPGQFALASTRESVSLSPKLSGRVEGKSSLARLGLVVHITAGFIDAGYNGTITLELINHGDLPLLLRPDMKIAQLSLTELKSPAVRPYGHPSLNSKYNGSTGTVGSRYGQ